MSQGNRVSQKTAEGVEKKSSTQQGGQQALRTGDKVQCHTHAMEVLEGASKIICKEQVKGVEKRSSTQQGGNRPDKLETMSSVKLLLWRS